MSWRGVVEEFRGFLPLDAAWEAVSLREGNTPLIPVPGLLGGERELYLKFEGMNPTGSFKDRGMAVAVTAARGQGARITVCASTGNTAAAAAAYSARAGMRSVVVIPEGKIARGKLAQSLLYGAAVLALEGNFDAALALVRRLVERRPDVALVNSVNPYRLEGQKTAAFEVVDALGGVPDYLAIPVGNAGNITAYWKGFREYRDAGRTPGVPCMLGFQAEGAAPLVRGVPVEHPETVATAIRIGNPASWQGAVAAARDSGGGIFSVTDAQILAAYRLLASRVGIFAEPASAAALAGVLQLERTGRLAPRARVVAVLTGHGLKDPDTAIDQAGAPRHVSAEVDALEEAVDHWSA
ncbi:MAG: threonine synthase [Thermaerobacter sp.]|nr:threonine synthase [Thermaerobacter sp.]